MNIKDYLHLYLGCDVMLWTDAQNPVFKPERKKLIAGRSETAFEISIYTAYQVNVKLILRPLNSMTDQDHERYKGIYFSMDNKLMHWFNDIHFEMTRHWLKEGFDLFGLIEAGLAIDKTTIKKESQ